MQTLASVLLFVCFALMWYAATANDMVPAQFRLGEDSLQRRIEFPTDVEDGTKLIRCAGTARKSGKFKNLACNETDVSDRLYIKEIMRSARSVKLIPALVNGEPAEVWFNFSVGLQKTGESTRVEVYPNHAYNLVEYGAHYTDPQRYNIQKWPVTCLEKKIKLQISAKVDATGKASDAVVVFGNTRDRCQEDLVSRIENGSYIPATAGGSYVSATYVEYWYNRSAFVR